MASELLGRKRRRRWPSVILAVIVVLVAARLALPYAMKAYINRRLSEVPDYTGHVDDVHLRLWRGAYVLKGLQISKSNGQIPVPLFSAKKIQLSLEWSALFHRSIVAEVSVESPEINIVTGPTAQTKQNITDREKEFRQKFQSLMPLRLDSLTAENGRVHFRDFHSNPKVDIYLADISLDARNLSNSRHLSKGLYAVVNANGVPMDSGHFVLHIDANTFAKVPTFYMSGQLTGLDLTKVNDFLQAYGNFDVKKGSFDLYTEAAAADGKFKGYVKPFFEDLQVSQWKQDVQQGVLHALWEKIVGLGATILKNKEQTPEPVATKIPIQGSYQEPGVDVWDAIGGLLKNAFVQALVPNIEYSVSLPGATPPASKQQG